MGLKNSTESGLNNFFVKFLPILLQLWSCDDIEDYCDYFKTT